MSKKLSWILRHGASKEGLQVTCNGFIKVSDILSHISFKNLHTEDDLIRIVKTNDKQRFSLCYNQNNELLICANQGHSMQVCYLWTDIDICSSYFSFVEY